MSAFTNLITFAAKLDGELLTEYQQLINAYMDEKYSLQNERIATSQANTGTYEVVAIAGTADTLLNEINVGDTVELNPNEKQSRMDKEYLVKDSNRIKSLNTVTDKATFSNGINIKVNKDSYWYRVELFRKVSTPSTNPHQPVQGC